MQCYLRIQFCDVVVRNAQAETLGNSCSHQNTFREGKAFADALPRPGAKGKIGKTVTITVVGWIEPLRIKLQGLVPELRQPVGYERT